MTTIDKIRADIIRRITDNTFGAKLELMDILSFLDTLEEPVSDDLEEAAEKYADLNCHNHVENETDWSGLLYAFKAGAEWQKKQIPTPEDTVLFQKGVEEGKRLMMEDAVEGEVVKDISNKLAATAKNINLDGLKFGDKVRIIILPEEEEQ